MIAIVLLIALIIFSLYLLIKGIKAVIYNQRLPKRHETEHSPIPEILNENVDLTQPLSLIFRKAEGKYFGMYAVAFLNPIVEEHWFIPDEKCAIHAIWSLTEKGSYGAYNLRYLNCSYEDIENVRHRFRTLGDLDAYFKRMENKYNEFKQWKQKHNELPDVL